MDIYRVLKDFEEEHPSVKIQFEIGSCFGLGKIKMTFLGDICNNNVIPYEIFEINNAYMPEECVEQMLEDMVRQAEDFEKRRKEHGYRPM